MKYWDLNLSSYDYFAKYIKPYVNNIKSMSYDRNKMPTYKRPDGTVENTFSPLFQGSGIFILNDGTTLYLSKTPNNSTCGIMFDLNGFKGPNIIGRDMFIFSILKNDPFYKLVPYGAYKTSDMPFGDWTRENTKKGSYACSRSGRGLFCAALIMIDGWEIKDDYPW